VGRKRPKKIPQIVIISGILIKSPHDDDDDDVFLLHLNFQDYQKPPSMMIQSGVARRLLRRIALDFDFN
jgi:hypothetical protein